MNLSRIPHVVERTFRRHRNPEMAATMQVSEFERAVWELEGVRIVIRASAQDEVGDYDFRNAANAGSTLATFIGNRVRPRIGDKEVVATGGTGEIVRAATHMQNIRATYAQE